ncbi:glycosyltransferase [Vibrio ezurae]|uniref:Glycosyltransferase 2-like domain-containing protein n=1 Tax=Vibrio ezurae NBRC 102218 TaxID=1219080 RepID=U3CNG7_9VIBR|nr:glycosyltransferase [Vibrio ezurae]GAD79653.1 hypothetical protein VEZ01S_19_00680 [Vibrio ezurae NBRC 102218]
MRSIFGTLDRSIDSVVLIPSYNDNKGLVATLESLNDEIELNVLIVDDGSKQPVVDLLSSHSFSQNIVVITLHENQGIIKALNTGLKFSYTEGIRFVFRLDACDINVKGRFEKQLNLLQSLDLALVGGGVEYFSEDKSEKLFLRPPLVSDEIAAKQKYRTCFVHPTVLLDLGKLKLDFLYSSKYQHAEDYELFLRVTKFFPTGNVDAIVTKCLVRFEGLSLTNRKLQLKSVLKAQCVNFDYLSLYSYFGLFKTINLLFIPRSFIEFLKIRVFKSYEKK